MLTVEDVLKFVDEIAPFELAEPWDNVGLLQGHRKAEVRNILVALDITEAVLTEAIQNDVQLIVTHHPFMFKPIQKLTDDSREGELMLALAEHHIAHIAAHTNLDAAPGGVNDMLLRSIGAFNVRGEGVVRVGEIGESTFASVCNRIREKLGAEVRSYGNPDQVCHVIGCCSGSGSDEYPLAVAMGADCFLTGEVRHNIALDALHDGIPIVEAGHYETERVICPVLASSLQKKLDALQYRVHVFCSAVNLLERRESVPFPS